MTKHSDDDYFKTDCTYQEKDSLLIMSKKELYRSLCIFFSQVFLECEITDCDFDLCDYLFEKDYPCYPKLLDRNKTHISDDEGNQYRLPVPTHEFIQYDYLESTFPHQAIFLKNLSRCLSLNVDLLPLFDVLCTISKSKFEQLRNRPFDSFAKNLKLCDYSKIYYKLRRESLSVKKRKKAAEKSRKTFERDGFEQIVLLDAGGLGAPNISFAWRDKWANFLKGLDDPSYIADDREVDEDEEGFIIYAKLQFIVDSLKQEYIRKIMQFYKNVLFQTYTREQINILKKYDLDDIK